MRYFVADSFQGYELIGVPYEKSSKLYSKARAQCDRCIKGVYVTRVENNQPVPHPAFGGVCLKCKGTGYIDKEIRLYTEKEKEAMVRAKQRKTEKQVQEKLQKAEEKKREWLEKNGFSAEGITTIYVGQDSFDIKDELKEKGWQYSGYIGWHIGQINVSDYDAEKIVELPVEQLAAFSLYGDGSWLSTAKNTVNQIRDSRRPQSKSMWIGEEKGKIDSLPIVVKRISGFMSKFGWTNIVTLLSGDDIITWITSTDIKLAEGENYYLSATIKEHKEYKSEKQTLIIRPKFLSLE